jgi:transcriptional regulator with XRE-family HTH domain
VEVTVPEPNPTVARRELAVYFRKLREQREHTLTQLAEKLVVTQGQASRLDSGARGFRPEDVEVLCDWYGLGRGERERLLEIAEEARRRAWWQQYDLDDSYRTLIGFEQAAVLICEFCNTVVPGLLQAEDYAMAAAEVGKIGNKPFVTRDAVAVRMRRQEILRRPDPPELSVLIDEAVLARGVGGSAVMRRQLDQLVEAAQRPRMEIRVIGFEAGMYPTAPSQFILLDVGSRLPPVYYSEDQLRPSDSSADKDIQRTRWLWDVLQSRALSPADSIRRIVRYRDEQIG